MRKIILLCFLFANGAIAAPNMELSFFLGPSISQNGNIEKLGDPNITTAFDFNYFFAPKHGIGISIGNEFDFEGSSKLIGLKDASIHTFDLHYAFRHRFKNSKVQFSLTPGIGYQTIYDNSTDYYWGYTYYEDLSSAWVLTYKAMFDYIFTEWQDEDSDGNFFAGIGISQIFSYDDRYQGQDISGNRLSGLLRIGVGF